MGKERSGRRWPRIRMVMALVGMGLPWLAACERDPAERDVSTPAEAPPVSWDSGQVRIHTDTDTLTLRVQIAETDAQRAFGLMERDTLAPDAGMIFTYQADQPGEAGFWMFNTRIPLDIAFLDAEGRIVAIRQMQPCSSPYPQWCPSHSPDMPYRAALEANLGYFERHGIEVGDRVELEKR